MTLHHASLENKGFMQDFGLQFDSKPQEYLKWTLMNI